MGPTTRKSATPMGRGPSWLPWLGVGVLAVAGVAVVDIATSTEPGPEAVRVPPSLTSPELIACAYNIVVGEVRNAEDAGRDEATVDVTMDADEWLKAGSPRRDSVEFTTLSPWYSGEPRLQSGERVLVIEWSYPYESATRVFRARARRGVTTLTDARAQIKRALPMARQTRCPDFWHNPERYEPGVPDDE